MRGELIKAKLALADRHAPLSDDSPCPFGKQYKGEPLRDVPEEFLQWWWRKNPDRSVLELEVMCLAYPKKAVALQKLKLWDYLDSKYNAQDYEEGTQNDGSY